MNGIRHGSENLSLLNKPFYFQALSSTKEELLFKTAPYDNSPVGKL